MSKILMLVLIASVVSACCNTGTTVVLVPDSGGKVGQVSLTTKAGMTVLSNANESAQATKIEQAPTHATVLSGAKIQAMFGGTLAKEPLPPEHFRLYFATGSDSLSQEASAEMPKIFAAVQSHKSCDMSVIGHSDRVGNDASNKGLSVARAENVAKLLASSGVKSDCMDVRYYGENDPAVPTADNVPEPRNRRVEVEIR